MKSTKLNQLQFLRFIAFSCIFLYHAFGNNLEPYLHLTNAAYAMVSFFFLLSGFGSGYSSADKHVKPTLKAILSHQWIKIKRIYPILFVSIIYCILQTNLPAAINTCNIPLLKENGWALLKCLLMIQAWWNPFLHYNGVTWFISAIMFLYLFDLPVRYLLDKLHNYKKEKSILAGFSFLLTIIIVITALFVKNQSSDPYFIYAFPPSRLAEYLLGMCVGRMVFRINSTTKNSKNIILYTFLEGFALILWISASFLPFPNNTFNVQVYWIFQNILVLIIIGMGHGGFTKLFSIKLFQHLGDISMECYLLHQPILVTYGTFIHMENTIYGTLFFVTFNFLFTILLSTLLHKKSV